MLNKEELQYISSIDIGYSLARRRWIEQNIPSELQEAYLKGKPVFIKMRLEL